MREGLAEVQNGIAKSYRERIDIPYLLYKFIGHLAEDPPPLPLAGVDRIPVILCHNDLFTIYLLGYIVATLGPDCFYLPPSGCVMVKMIM